MPMNPFTEAHTSVGRESTAPNGMVHPVVFVLSKGLALVLRMQIQS